MKSLRSGDYAVSKISPGIIEMLNAVLVFEELSLKVAVLNTKQAVFKNHYL
jgi:hypothetical protein